MKAKILILIVFPILFSCVSNKENPPNIILIMADDMGYGDISCFGSEFIQTPVLDKMASEGIKFTDYHSNGAVCTPTRAALMTGNYQQRAGLEGVIYAALDKRMFGIQDSEKTIAEIFKDAGYSTGIFGKWHLGYQPEYNPVHHGFDEFYGYVSGNVDFISHRDGVGLYDWWHNTDTAYEEGYVTDLITDFALKFMERNKKKPFLLYIPHEAPHYPYQGRNDKADRLPGVNFQGHGSRPDKKQAYKEMVEIMDENIGRVMDKLKDLGIEKNTFVFFCSDNGATNLGNNGTLNGFKGSLWEGGHRVPAIAWYPEKIEAGAITESTVLGIDVLPTLLSVAGIDTDNKFDGKDFSEVLFSGNQLNERPLFWRYRNQWVVRRGDWKYLKIKEKEYLFNLKIDIGEQNNLIETNSERASDLKYLLEKWENEMAEYELKTE
ncbi:MAG: sulfatase-like hydrolase/transferase [Prolixibacteraceae bacterium]|jgi:arylsulfatase A|nr:sulfatase-like hydrolase/transferase [Prolixibacteraceae bacterium]MBT6767065.1 sulfatase-like hydrolase/transferase [Prolixibacteraceae bacterium]MBT6997424.1 sulfatase-like hydrolase/transferase [Prolixibacteraceae bacterium]MBT7396635.1 sulfatase-like hydrolase/transferase [Prolixibacteraceae bacterium]